jgi:hypothetical protein
MEERGVSWRSPVSGRRSAVRNLEHWNPGTLEHWNIGTLENKNIVLLISNAFSIFVVCFTHEKRIYIQA